MILPSKKVFIIIMLLWSLLLSLVSFGKNNNDNTWYPFNAFYFTDQNIYAADNNGNLMISHDGGTSWVTTKVISSADSIAAHIYAKDKNIYAANWIPGSYGVSISHDDGKSWIRKTQLLDDGGYFSPYHCGGDGDNIYIPSLQSFWSPTYRLYKSYDNGSTWQLLNLSVDDLAMYPISTITSHGSEIYVGLECRLEHPEFGCEYPKYGFLISKDNGTTWRKSLDSWAVNDSYITGSNIYVIAHNSNRATLFISHDSGSVWQEIPTPKDAYNLSSVFVSGATIVLGVSFYGVAISADNGEHWRIASIAQGLSGTKIYKVYGFGSKLFSGEENGLFESTDGGEHWHPILLPSQKT